MNDWGVDCFVCRADTIPRSQEFRAPVGVHVVLVALYSILGATHVRPAFLIRSVDKCILYQYESCSGDEIVFYNKKL